MATITPTKKNRSPSEEVIWTPITEADTPAGTYISGGRYTYTVAGTFGGTSIALQYSKDGSSYHAIDATNLTFTAAGSYNLEIGAGWLKPVRTGGSSTSVSCYLTPIE